MCEYLGVSRSGYYSYRKRKNTAELSPRERQDLADFKLIKDVYDFRGYAKGSRTIAMLLPRLYGVIMNRKKISRLMAKYELICPIRRPNPYRQLLKRLQTTSIFSNKINRHFKTNRPGQHLLSDISYIYYGTQESKLCYLSAIKDASTNEIISWTISKNLALDFVIEMLDKLEDIKWLPSSFVIHTDQGAHYTSSIYRRWLSSKNISQSMSRRGNCWDNAPMESFFGHAKDELHLKSCHSFEDVYQEMENYIDYYNNDRPQVGLGKMTPSEFREYLLIQPKLHLVPIEIKKINTRPSVDSFT